MMDLLKILSTYKKGQLIYPGVLIRRLNVTMSVAYQVLEIIKRLKIIIVVFEVYCHRCGRFTGEIYNTIGEIPESDYCENCDSELTSIQNSVAVYKVIFDE